MSDFEIDDTPPEKTPERLRKVWRKLAKGKASSQERIDAVWLAGELGDRSRLDGVKALLEDEDELVRYYALQALVLDLHERTTASEESCWRMLAEDPDDGVRHMATTCLGSLYYGSRRKDVFERMAAMLRGDQQSGYVKGGVYSALKQLAGLPPSEWIAPLDSRKVFEESDIDWAKVTELEALMA